MSLHVSMECKFCKGRGLTTCMQGHVVNCPVCEGFGAITMDFETLWNMVERNREDHREED